MPYISSSELQKKYQTHKRDHLAESLIHGKKDFIPYVENRRVLDASHINPILYDEKYNEKRGIYRIVDKEKWTDPVHDFKKVVKIRSKW